MKSSKRYVVVLSAVLLLLTATVISADDGNQIDYNPNPPSEVSEPAIPPVAPSAIVTMTHSASQAVIQNSVACVNNATGFTVENSYWRVFDPANEFGVTGGDQPLEVRLYTVDGAFVVANLTQIGSASFILPDQNLTLYNIPVTGTVPAGAVLAVEVYSPDGVTDGNRFFIGSNDSGENADSYIWSPPCGITEPTPFSGIGFGNVHVVMNVYGDTVTPTDVSLTTVGGEATAGLWLPLLAGLVAIAAAGAFVMRRRVTH